MSFLSDTLVADTILLLSTDIDQTFCTKYRKIEEEKTQTEGGVPAVLNVKCEIKRKSTV